jgi:hypothetical protein
VKFVIIVFKWVIDNNVMLCTPSIPDKYISKVILSQTFKTLTEFLDKPVKIYDIKLVSSDIS